jgi:hypothetical protein
MHKTNAIFASSLGILSLVIFTTSSLNNPALGQLMMTGNSSGNGMSLGTMNFANIFNGSSFFGALGTSIVNGVKVVGINVLPNNDVSVTLKHIITNPSNTTLPGGVTVTAIRVPLNLRDVISAASAVSNSTRNGGNNVMNMTTGPVQGFGATKRENSTSIMSNPFAFPKTIQIGSSSIANPNWKLPQSVTMGLVGMIGSSNSLQTADFIIVSVIPFTGKSTQ